MSEAFQLLVLVIVGILLLWFGYTIFARFGGTADKKPRHFKDAESLREGKAGNPRTCPVCSLKLENGERVKSSAFPSFDGRERLMHIAGCPYCLNPENRRKRVCPVCTCRLSVSDYLLARMFEKPGRSHVHVLGCNHCRRG